VGSYPVNLSLSKKEQKLSEKYWLRFRFWSVWTASKTPLPKKLLNSLILYPVNCLTFFSCWLLLKNA
jgi:hypothetical protein